MAKDEIATKLSAVRALEYAKRNGGKLLTLCSACHNVIKRTNEDMRGDENISFKANNYLKFEEPYRGETQVLHYLELLKNEIGFDEIAKKVVRPLNRKIGAYYGCLLLRPSGVMAFDNPENPTIIEDFIRAVGGTPSSILSATNAAARTSPSKTPPCPKQGVKKCFKARGKRARRK